MKIMAEERRRPTGASSKRGVASFSLTRRREARCLCWPMQKSGTARTDTPPQIGGRGSAPCGCMLKEGDRSWVLHQGPLFGVVNASQPLSSYRHPWPGTLVVDRRFQANGLDRLDWTPSDLWSHQSPLQVLSDTGHHLINSQQVSNKIHRT